jgi:hypothetical protein
VFHPVPPPDTADLQALAQRIAERLGRMREGGGLVERDAESAWLSGGPKEAGALDDLIGHSITCRIAVGLGHPARRTREARTPVPLREPPAGGDGTPRADTLGAGALPTQDPVPRRTSFQRVSACDRRVVLDMSRLVSADYVKTARD